MLKLQKSKSIFFISVPAEIVRFKNWQKGKEFIWTMKEDGALLLKEMKRA